MQAVAGTTPFSGNGAYASYDVPATPATQVASGVVYYGNVTPGTEQDFFTITMSSAATFRLGVLTDNTDNAGISPAQLRVRQTAGSGGGNSGLVASPNRQTAPRGSYYFFDVTAAPGDTLVVSGVDAAGFDSNGLYGVTFDVPEPASAGLLGVGAVGVLARRQRRRAVAAA